MPARHCVARLVVKIGVPQTSERGSIPQRRATTDRACFAGDSCGHEVRLPPGHRGFDSLRLLSRSQQSCTDGEKENTPGREPVAFVAWGFESPSVHSRGRRPTGGHSFRNREMGVRFPSVSTIRVPRIHRAAILGGRARPYRAPTWFDSTRSDRSAIAITIARRADW